MTVKEYNSEFLPKIKTASILIKMMDKIIDHMDIGEDGRNEVKRILKIYGYSDETKETIIKALEYYRIHEGIDNLELNFHNRIEDD